MSSSTRLATLVLAAAVAAGCPGKPQPNLDLLGRALPPPALPEAPRLSVWRHTDPHPVVAVLPEKDAVWLGTGWGLVRAAPDGSSAVRFGPEAGLTNPSVTALARDGGGFSGSARRTAWLAR